MLAPIRPETDGGMADAVTSDDKLFLVSSIRDETVYGRQEEYSRPAGPTSPHGQRPARDSRNKRRDPDSPMVLDQAAPVLRFGGHHG